MRRPVPFVIAAIVGLLLPTLGMAKAPTKREVDQTLLGLSTSNLAPVAEAEEQLHQMEQHKTTVEYELAIAKLDLTAAKAWVDASKAVSDALDASEKAAQAASRTDELEDFAGRKARGKQTTEWREARWAASRSAVALQQARLSLAKSEIIRAGAQIELARLEVYNEAIGTSADVEVELGKTQTKIGRMGTQVGRDRKKAEEAERDYDNAIMLVGQLDPSLD